MSKLLMVLLVMLSVAGCSNKAIYDKFRLDQRDKCAEKPSTDYFKCIEHTNKSYEEYERERKELTEKQKQIDVGGSQKNKGIHEE